MDILARRAQAIFNELLPETVRVLVLYFRKRNVLGYGAGIFWRDMREPRVITMNPHAWERVKARGLVYQFTPSDTFFLSGRSDTADSSANNL